MQFLVGDVEADDQDEAECETKLRRGQFSRRISFVLFSLFSLVWWDSVGELIISLERMALLDCY